MDFVKSYFGKNDPLTRSGKKRGTKVFDWSEVHFYRRTSYKIHTLASETFPGYPFWSTKLLTFYSKTASFKQFCTLRAGNLGNVLLISWICLRYFYQ